MAQEVKHPTLGFGSGSDLTDCEKSCQHGAQWDSFFPLSWPLPSNKQTNKQYTLYNERRAKGVSKIPTTKVVGVREEL